jgi:hypothetical protein
MRITFSLALIASACVWSSAQGVANAAPKFIAEPGVQEFSGRLIARPVPMDQLLQRGLNAYQAQRARQEAAMLAERTTLRYIPETDEYILQVPEGATEQSTADWLMRTGSFQYVEPDWTVYPVAVPNDPQYGQQWHLPKIEAPTAWNHNVGEGNIIVAITDTGVRLDHQDLAARLVPGANSATGTAIPQASGGQVNDINGHGTHCAGIAGAIGNNGVGVSGVAWNVRIMPIRVTNSSGGSSSISALTAGARWAADNGARVVSTSYSGYSNSAVQTTGNYIKYSRNGIYLWAAGNSNVNITTDHIDVTVVGSTNQSDGKSSFSNYGPGTDVYAPGSDIRSTYNSSATSYATLSGTSMACPGAAGLSALIMGTNPSLTGAQVETILYETCNDLGTPGNDTYWGWGRINARAAVQRSYGTVPFLPDSYSIVAGSPISGNLSSLGGSDDNRVVFSEPIVGSGRFAPITLQANLTSTNNQVGSITLAVEASASRNGINQRLQMFDFNANDWVTVDLRAASLTDTTTTVQPSVPSRFRQAGTGLVQVRVTYEADPTFNAFKSAQGRVDRISVLTGP